jgi:Rrf2 family protein
LVRGRPFAMKLSRTISYALAATVRLAQQQDSGTPVPCSKLAEEGQMPERFLIQILRELVNAGVLRSIRGVDGGYRLARPATQITLLNIVEAFESPLETALPPIPSTPITTRTRILAQLHLASNAARNEMHKLTIADLV